MLTELEKKLVEINFEQFTLDEQNRLTGQISMKKGIPTFKINEEYILAYHKQLKIDAMSEKCEKEIVTGFLSENGNFYRTNRDDQVNMIGQKDELSANLEMKTVSWKTEDKGYLEHSRQDWLNVYIEAFSHKKTQLTKYDTLKSRILNAKTHQEVIDVKWT